MNRSPVAHIDDAIAQVASAGAVLRDVDPAVVSATIAAVRELCWRIDSLTAALAATYRPGRCVAHDHADDPGEAITAIMAGLASARQHLTNLDMAFGEVHNHAAHLFTPTGRAHR